MPEKLKFRLSSMWLFVSLSTIVLPVFMPSFNSFNPASNAIGVATAAMFILSFPSSLFGLFAMMLVGLTLELNPDSIEGLYVNLLIMFALGLVQWFWIVPRIWNRDPAFQTVEIGAGWLPRHVLPRAVPEQIFTRYDADGRTPVECVIAEEWERETADGIRSK
jgi:hypothetical protein